MPDKHSRFIGSAKLIAACTLISRVTGLARDIVMNFKFGQGWVQDAFTYGFQIPNLFRRLFGEGALSAVFIPIFTDVLDKEGKARAWTLLGRVAGLLVLTLTVVTVLLELVALAIWHFAPGGPMRELQLGLSAVMLPFMISICVLALLSSILNCLNHFTVPALVPIVLNVMNILGVLIVGPLMGGPLERQVYGVAFMILAAGIVQLWIILPTLRKHGVTFRLSLNWADPAVRAMARMFLPVVIGQGVLLLSVFLDTQVCTYLTRGPSDPPTRHFFGMEFNYPLQQGALSAMSNAQRLYQFPLGVLAISLATAAFPMFSLYGSRKDYVGLRNSLGQALRVAVFEGMPSGVILIILAQPIIALLFQHGRYGPEDTVRAAWVLKWYAIGMPAYCSQQIILRGFYSLKDTMTPMWIGCGLVALNFAINVSLLWHPSLHEAAFGIVTVTTATLHVLISTWLLRRAMQGRIGARAVVASFLRTLVASAVAGLTAWLLLRWFQGMNLHTQSKLIVRALNVFGPLLGAMAVYLATAKFILRDEMSLILSRSKKEVIPPSEPLP